MAIGGGHPPRLISIVRIEMITKNGIRRWILSPIIIGAIFWLADGLLSFCGEILSTRVRIITKTIALPAVSIIVLMAVVKIFRFSARVISALSFLGAIGVWVLGPFYLLVMSVFSKTGFTLMELKALPMLIIGLPMTTISVSTYSGGLGGLILTSICLPVAGIIIEKTMERGMKHF